MRSTTRQIYTPQQRKKEASQRVPCQGIYLSFVANRVLSSFVLCGEQGFVVVCSVVLQLLSPFSDVHSSPFVDLHGGGTGTFRPSLICVVRVAGVIHEQSRKVALMCLSRHTITCATVEQTLQIQRMLQPHQTAGNQGSCQVSFRKQFDVCVYERI